MPWRLLCGSLPSMQETKLIQRVEACIQRAEEVFERSFARPLITMKQRGRIAGSARLKPLELRFNPVLYRENEEAFLNEVVPHEVCHLLIWQLFPGERLRPHGREWRALMQSLYGLPGHAKHEFDVSSVRGKTHIYRCGCREHELSTIRHNRIVRRKAEYRCKDCHQVLKAAG